MKPTRCLCIFILCVFTGSGICQPGQPPKFLSVQSFGLEHGLRQSMVTAVLQDHRGLIWVTTGNGLHCFDGRQFHPFRVSIDRVFTHTDNMMYDLTEDTPGEFIVTTASSVLRFNAFRGSFDVLMRRERSWPFLIHGIQDTPDQIWLNPGQLFTILRDSLVRVPIETGAPGKVPDGFSPHQAVSFRKDSLFLSGTGSLLLLTRHADKQTSRITMETKMLRHGESVAIDRRGNLFMLAGGKIIRYRPGGISEVLFDTGILDPMDLFIDSRNNFWITSHEKNRQYLYAGGVLSELRFVRQEGRFTDSLVPAIRTIFEDRNGNIWMGTDGDGVLLYAPEQVRFLKAVTGFTRCIEWYSGKFWAGTYQNGLWTINEDFTEAERQDRVGSDRQDYYLDLETDRRGRLWMVTREEVRVMDNQGHILFRQKLLCRNARLDCVSGDTMLCYSDSRMIRFQAGHTIAEAGAVPFFPVQCFLHTTEADWYGNSYGLFMLPAGGRGKIPVNTLSGHAVYSLVPDHSGIWAATANGIEVFDSTGRKTESPHVVGELRNETVYALVPGPGGRFWFSGNRGIGWFDPVMEKLVWFNRSSNLQSLEFNSNAVCVSPSGMICFGGTEGVNGFNPEWFKPSGPASGAALLTLVAGDTAWNGGIAPSYAEIRLSRMAPHISGSVFCPDYTQPGAQLFSFFLEGFHHDWTTPSHSPEFLFRDLPPGSFRLMVKCADATQQWSTPVALLSVTLRPPFWKTYWFLVLLIITIAAMTAWLVRKLNSIRYRQRIMELERVQAIERERTRISKDMHDEIGAGLTRISILGELAKKRLDDREAALALVGQISDIAGNTVDEMGEIIWAMNPKNDTLDSFSAYLRQYALSYLETAGIKVLLDFPGEVPPWFMPAELRRNLFLVVKEALHNIVRHSGAGKAEISLHTDLPEIRIDIRDQGRGFREDMVRPHGNGLVNMRRRMEDTGGSISVETEPGRGTILRLSVKLPEHENHPKR